MHCSEANQSDGAPLSTGKWQFTLSVFVLLYSVSQSDTHALIELVTIANDDIHW